jgi:uncharacterized damage-inducible protein DinB
MAGFLSDLFHHAAWADARAWRSVLATPAAASDGKIRFWLHHIHIVQHVFRRLWEGDDLAVPQLDAFDDLQSLVRWGREGHENLRRFFETVPDDRLDEVLELPWTELIAEQLGQSPGPIRLRETALQVALHTTHHRGQIVARVRELGGEPRAVDYSAWVWLGRPAPDWPEEAAQRHAHR